MHQAQANLRGLLMGEEAHRPHTLESIGGLRGRGGACLPLASIQRRCGVRVLGEVDQLDEGA